MGVIVRIAKGTASGGGGDGAPGVEAPQAVLTQLRASGVASQLGGCALTVGAVASATGGIRNGGLIERDCK